MTDSRLKTGSPRFQKDNEDRLLQGRINRRVKSYLESVDGVKLQRLYYAKAIMLVLLGSSCYGMMLLLGKDLLLLAIFMLMALTFNLILGITIGHDAAHGAITGNRHIDNGIFQVIFAANGINPAPWKDRHNKSHHHSPNVHEVDSDIAITPFIYLSPTQRKMAIHGYQHLYAPFLYLLFTIAWILFVDVQHLMAHLKDSEVKSGKQQKLLILLMIKLLYLSVYLLIPSLITGHSPLLLLGIWCICQMLISLFLSFTFFLSHHVQEAEYYSIEDGQELSSSWFRVQVSSTIDFHGQSPLANLIFGGFHAHVAHHLFPSLSHIYYPRVTRIIRQELESEGYPYTSLNFFSGVASHLKLLRDKGKIQ